MTDKIKTVELVWTRLPELEAACALSVSKSLAGWEDLIIACLEAGMLAPMITNEKQLSMRLVTAAPFLKCSLDDLRAIWILVERGYTAQAAAVAAALFENAMVAAAIAGSDDLALVARKSKHGEIPWGAKELCQLTTKLDMERDGSIVAENAQKQYEDNWTIAYFHYKWLCQVKHPTWQAVSHAARSTAVGGRKYAVRPGPNILEDDLQVKARVLAVSLSKSLMAIRSFFLSLDGNEQSDEYRSFEEKFSKAYVGVMDLIKKQEGKRSPIRVLNRSFIKTDFSTLKEKFGE